MSDLKSLQGSAAKAIAANEASDTKAAAQKPAPAEKEEEVKPNKKDIKFFKVCPPRIISLLRTHDPYVCS